MTSTGRGKRIDRTQFEGVTATPTAFPETVRKPRVTVPNPFRPLVEQSWTTGESLSTPVEVGKEQDAVRLLRSAVKEWSDELGVKTAIADGVVYFQTVEKRKYTRNKTE